MALRALLERQPWIAVLAITVVLAAGTAVVLALGY
jgi:hypothetical protein